jgi:hypothetical protein
MAQNDEGGVEKNEFGHPPNFMRYSKKINPLLKRSKCKVDGNMRIVSTLLLSGR